MKRRQEVLSAPCASNRVQGLSFRMMSFTILFYEIDLQKTKAMGGCTAMHTFFPVVWPVLVYASLGGRSTGNMSTRNFLCFHCPRPYFLRNLVHIGSASRLVHIFASAGRHKSYGSGSSGVVWWAWLKWSSRAEPRAVPNRVRSVPRSGPQP